MIWLNQIIQGILLGGFYTLMAIGLAFMFSVMRIINLAHGALAIMAAFGIYVLADQFDMNPFVALIPVLPVMALLGWMLQWFILERSSRGGELLPILSTFGLSIVLENLLFQQFGANTRSLAPFIDSLSYEAWGIGGNIWLGKLPVLIFVVAVAILAILQLILNRTFLGRAIRATAEKPDTVGLLGINPRIINATATSIAMVTIGIAGMFMAMRGTFTPYSGPIMLIFAFEAAVIGGTGSLWGTLAGGIILAVAQSIGAQIHPQGFLIAGHLVFLLILLVRVYSNGFSLSAIVTPILRSKS